MYTFFQPRISVEQEEDNIKSMIDREYELKNKKSVIITSKWKNITTNKWNMIDYGIERLFNRRAKSRIEKKE